ncbi:MAG: N-glycosylase/DNA lyase [Thermoplasmata archaeon]
MDEELVDLKRLYGKIKDHICQRIEDFEAVKSGDDDERYFEEMAFCLFTPQSKAKSCWDAVEELKENELLEKGIAEDISKVINQVRFRNRKAVYFVEARDKFGSGGGNIKNKIMEMEDVKDTRGWLVDNVKGLGYKEASHYLRNIGLGKNIAILDRHILRNLERYNVIEEVPTNLTPSKYVEIEEKMKAFSERVNIPLHHLDLLLWYKETGEIFK